MSRPIDRPHSGGDGGASAKNDANPSGDISPSFIEALINGEPQAYYQLVQDNIGPLSDFLFSVLHNQEDTEDIIQDVFVYIWEHRDTLSQVRKLNNYIFSIAKYRAFKEKKMKQKFMNYDSGDFSDKTEPAGSPEEIIEKNESENAVCLALKNMPDMRRTVYDMSRNLGYSNDEISARLNIAPTTVRRHLSLALQDIRALLSTFR